MGPENIPVFFLQLTLPYIVEPLTYIYNLCIKRNTFPSSLKLAKVIPLPKVDDKSKPDNFRPISLLPLLSKPLERHFHKHLYMYLQERSLLHINQSGFRPAHSCHTSLINLCDSCRLDNYVGCLTNTYSRFSFNNFWDFNLIL